MHRAEGWSEKWPEEVKYWQVVKDISNPWTYGQTAITFAFLIASFIVVNIASQENDSNKQSKLEIKASGENIKVQAEAGNK